MQTLAPRTDTIQRGKSRYINDLPLVDRLFADCVVKEAESRGMLKRMAQTKPMQRAASRTRVLPFGWRLTQH